MYLNKFENENIQGDTSIGYCSFCKKGEIIFNPNNIKVFETVESAENFLKRPKGWDIYWIDKYYTGTMNCDNKQCLETYIVSGVVEVKSLPKKQESGKIIENYKLKYIYPVFHLFEVPEDIPYEIEEALKQVFILYWIDESACANAIRTCIELVMDDKRISKSFKDAKGIRRKKTLHQRIEDFKLQYNEIAQYLMAAKWIGNAGSHSGDLYYEQIEDGLNLLETSLKRLYDSSHLELVKKAKLINKRRKPIN